MIPQSVSLLGNNFLYCFSSLRILTKSDDLNQFIREHWHYNNAHQEVVTSIHFVQINKIFFAKLLGFKPTPAGPSHLFSPTEPLRN